MIGGIMIMTIMMAMMIEVTGVMPMITMQGMVQAHVTVQVPALIARAVIEMTFPAPARSNRADWTKLAYDRALMMLDPA